MKIEFTDNTKFDFQLVPVATLDEEIAQRFEANGWNYIIIFANGSVMGFETEEGAATYQRQWRFVHGRNPMTGEKCSS